MPPVASRRGPGVPLAVTVVAGAALLAALSLLVPAPRILSDELRYTLAAASLAEGDGLQVRGHEYEFGPAYPTLLAGVLAVEPTREDAYPLFKALNALLFALTAVTAYLLARRLLPSAWSLAVAVLALLVPSSVYTSLVMTESAAYPAAALAMLLIVVALERPSVGIQLAALASIGLAVVTRPQFAVLLVSYLAALPLRWAIAPAARPAGSMLVLYRPTLGAFVLGLAGFAAFPLLTGTSYAEQLGAYHELWRGYDPVDVARWVAHHLAALELYLAVVPFAVAPIVLLGLVRAARGGSARSAAFASAFLTINAGLLLVAAAFSSTQFGFDRLHDRYLFYVVPLWLVVLALWVHEGLPRPLEVLALGAALALVLPAFVPFRELSAAEGGAEVDAVVTALWSRIHEAMFALSPDHLSGRRVVAVFVVALLVAVATIPRRAGSALVAFVAGVLLAGSAFAWVDARGAAAESDAILGPGADWVDRAVGPDAEVTSLYVASCGPARQARLGLLLTEFFNRSVVDAAHVVHPDGSLLPSTQVRISDDGTLVREEGGPLETRYVLTPPEVELEGRVVAVGTALRVLLWEVDGAVRAVGGRRIGAIDRGACPRQE